jgi:hypothetical protein
VGWEAATADFVSLARSYVERRPGLSSGFVSAVGGTRLVMDERFCLDVADLFEGAPLLAWSDELADDYMLFKQESLAQYDAIRAAGLVVRPWPHDAQPYRDSSDMVRTVRETGVLHVYLTSAGHGPGRPQGFHPLREPSGIREHGVELTHNDIFRVVHDVFGHVVHGNTFGPSGEFRATYCHMAMYPERVHPVLMTEQIGQICWFFYGPHLRVDGRIPRRGDPGYLEPARRPYAQQKVFPFPRGHVSRFKELFKEEPV